MSSDIANAVRNMILLEMLQVEQKTWSEAKETGEPILVKLFVPKEIKKFFDETLLRLVPGKQAEFETAIFSELIRNGLIRISTKMYEDKEDIVANMMRVAESMHDRENPL